MKRAQKVVCATLFSTGYVLAQDWQSRAVDQYSTAAPGALERVKADWPRAEIRDAARHLRRA